MSDDSCKTLRATDRGDRRSTPQGLDNCGSSILTLRAKAYRKFVDALISRNIRPGQFVTQKQLVALTGFPLGAVRELIPRLEGDGLISTLNRRGLQIAHVDVNLVRNAYQLRLIIEKEAVAQFIKRASDELILNIEADHRRIIDKIAKPFSQKIADDAQKVDWNFHDAIVESLDNEIISNVYGVNSIKIRLTYQDKLRVTAHNLSRVMTEHIAIIEAIKMRDEAAAVRAIAYHIDASRAVALGNDPTLKT
jgi:DNA-binding GntR family transcriptional regulator